MIPKVSPCGRSFKGLFAYCMSDKNAETSERVAWTRALNVPDLGKETWRIMVHTVRSARLLKRSNGACPSGRKLERPVFTYSLSWAPDQQPDQPHMEETALRSLRALGLEEHEAWLVSHNDTKHPNLHVIVNRVHPLTGYAATLDCSARKLQQFASDYERETKVYCFEREKNRREKEDKAPAGLKDLQKIWYSGVSGREFVDAVEAAGFQVFSGRKRPVFVCPKGRIFNPVRVLEGVTAKELRKRLAKTSLAALPPELEAPYSHQKSVPKLSSDVQQLPLS